MKITDTEARLAAMTIIEYCVEHTCDTCALSHACYKLRGEEMPPDEMPTYDLQPKPEPDCVESDADPMLHVSYVDHDGNVVFVD
jgi:hypothetical protein